MMAKRSLRLFLAVTESIFSRKPVDIPLEDENFDVATAYKTEIIDLGATTMEDAQPNIFQSHSLTW